MINAEVQKSGAESTLAVIRKFSRRVQGTGLIQTVRGGRYFARNSSKAVSKKRALKRIARQEKYRDLIKEGKVVEPPVRTHRAPRETSAPSTGRSSGLGESTPIAR
jgi:ribosomal protein S21